MILKKFIIFSLTFILGGSSIVSATLEDRNEEQTDQGLRLKQLHLAITEEAHVKREEANTFAQDIIKKAKEAAKLQASSRK